MHNNRDFNNFFNSSQKVLNKVKFKCTNNEIRGYIWTYFGVSLLIKLTPGGHKTLNYTDTIKLDLYPPSPAPP